MKSKKELVTMLLTNKKIETNDYEALLNMLVDESISVDTDEEDENHLALREKLADKVAQFIGSWGFIVSFCVFLLLWIIINSYLLSNNAFDPYPFILLNLFLSCVAAIQAPLVMMSQNRISKKETLRSKNDYKIDLKSELILEDLHNRILKIEVNQKRILDYIANSINDDLPDNINVTIKKEK